MSLLIEDLEKYALHSCDRSDMEIRQVRISDSEDLFLWRNDPLSRAMSIHMDPISPREHEAWVSRTFFNNSKKIYIGVLEGIKIGVAIFDLENNMSNVSINMNPAARNRGLSYYLLSDCILEYRKSVDCSLRAVIKKENIKSIKLFEKCGFYFLNSDKEFCYYHKD